MRLRLVEVTAVQINPCILMHLELPQHGQLLYAASDHAHVRPVTAAYRDTHIHLQCYSATTVVEPCKY